MITKPDIDYSILEKSPHLLYQIRGNEYHLVKGKSINDSLSQYKMFGADGILSLFNFVFILSNSAD